MSRDVCYYDGQCGLCRRSVRFLRAMDWLGRLAFQDMTRVSPEHLPVRFEDAMRGLPMRTSGGRILVGFAAMRRALVQTPLGVLPGLVMYLPGISHLGRRVYRWVADHRRRDLSCAVPVQGRPESLIP